MRISVQIIVNLHISRKYLDLNGTHIQDRNVYCWYCVTVPYLPQHIIVQTAKSLTLQQFLCVLSNTQLFTTHGKIVFK